MHGVRYTGAESRWYLEFGTRFAPLKPRYRQETYATLESVRKHATQVLFKTLRGNSSIFVADLRGGYQFTSNLRADLAVKPLRQSLPKAWFWL